MPQRKSGLQELKKNRRRRMLNLDITTDLKKTIKNFKSLVETKPDEAKSTLKLVYKKLDKASKRNIIHKNTAARRKSQLTRLLNKKSAS